PIEGYEPGLADLLAVQVGASRLRASADYAALKDCDVVIIAVETPVGNDNKPGYEAMRKALTALEQVLKTGALVIIESTIAPGTIQNVILPLLQANGKRLNTDFYLGHCPERVMPGRLLHNLHNMNRAVGGM